MKIIYLFIAFFISTNLYSQIREKQTIELTGKVGKSSFRLYFQNNRSSSLSSINFGIIGDYYLNKTWSIQTGLLYQKMGGTTYSHEHEIDYINIPFNMNWHFGKTKKWNLNFGIIQSFRTSSSLNTLGATIKNTQTAINLGFGYRIKVNDTIGILLDYQFLSGMNNINKDELYSITNKGGNINLGIIVKI